jgi:hypothetical protein
MKIMHRQGRFYRVYRSYGLKCHEYVTIIPAILLFIYGEIPTIGRIEAGAFRLKETQLLTYFKSNAITTPAGVKDSR